MSELRHPNVITFYGAIIPHLVPSASQANDMMTPAAGEPDGKLGIVMVRCLEACDLGVPLVSIR